MRRLPLAVLAPAAIAVAACSSGAPAPAASPSLPAAEQAAITSMTAYCTQDAGQLAAMLSATHGLEVKAGIKDETEAQLAGHLLKVVQANKSRVSCVQEFAAYVTMREGGKG